MDKKDNQIIASIIICHHDGDARYMYEVEGQNDEYYCGASESKVRAILEPATVDVLMSELNKLGVKIEDKKSIVKVADKFYDELRKRKGGRIVYSDRPFYQGFYKVFEYLEPSGTLQKLGL